MILERHCVRAILVTPEHDVLLMRIRPPEGGDGFWITPGGGLDPGETLESGLRRELREEVGLEELTMGPLVWRRRHTFSWGEKRLCQYEEYHLIRVPRFEPRMSDPYEITILEQFRWWPLAELAQTEADVTPRSLAAIVARFLADGAPRELPDVEVVVE